MKRKNDSIYGDMEIFFSDVSTTKQRIDNGINKIEDGSKWVNNNWNDGFTENKRNYENKTPNSKTNLIYNVADSIDLSNSIYTSGDRSFEDFSKGVFRADKMIKTLPKISQHNKYYLNKSYVTQSLARGVGDFELEKLASGEIVNILEDSAFNREYRFENRIDKIDINDIIEKKDRIDYDNNLFSTDTYLGDGFDDVKAEQRFLNQNGVTDKFGEMLNEDGVVGPNTIFGIGNTIKGFSRVNSEFGEGIQDILDQNGESIFGNDFRIRENDYKKADLIPDNNLKNRRIKSNNLFYKNNRVFGIDSPHGGEYTYHHINTIGEAESNNLNLNKLQKKIAKSTDHAIKISPKTADAFKSFDDIARGFKNVGKAAGVVGIVADAIGVGNTIYKDFKDDGNLGVDSAKSAGGAASAWAGGAVGAKGGFAAGAALGTLIFPGIGTAIGGFVGGLAGSIFGAWGGRKVSDAVVESIYEEA